MNKEASWQITGFTSFIILFLRHELHERTQKVFAISSFKLKN
jgi:hypothetical protein